MYPLLASTTAINANKNKLTVNICVESSKAAFALLQFQRRNLYFSFKHLERADQNNTWIQKQNKMFHYCFLLLHLNRPLASIKKGFISSSQLCLSALTKMIGQVKKFSLAVTQGLVISNHCLEDHPVTKTHWAGGQWSVSHFPQW